MKNHFITFSIIAIAGAITFAMLYQQVFPQAEVRFAVTKEDAEKTAEAYLTRLGYATEGYTQATILEADTLAQIFLQRQWGIARFNKELAADKTLTPWNYTVRFFRPLEKEEFMVAVRPDGQVSGFAHLIAENAEGARLSKEEAERIARAFAERELGLGLARYEEKEYHDTKQENRTDHVFSFEQKGSEITGALPDTGGATRLDIALHGDTIASFGTYVYVPESFVRSQETTESHGFLYVAIATVAEVLLMLVAIFVLFKRYRAYDIRPRYIVGIAIALAGISIIGALVSYEDLLYAYETTLSWGSFLTFAGVFFFIALLVETLVTLIAGFAGESLTREVFPSANDFDPQMPRTRAYILRSAATGLLAAGGFLGYLALFYFFGSRSFGIWSPVEPETIGYATSILPALVPVIFSLSAALSEELAFRYLGVSLLKKYFRHTLLALFCSAVIWAFLHSTYAVFPMHVRGIELTVVGMLLGGLFIRHGILAAVSAHFFINLVLFTAPLLLSDNTYFQLSGVAAALLGLAVPVGYALVAGKRGRETTPPQADAMYRV